jgi:hypothetical protein
MRAISDPSIILVIYDDQQQQAVPNVPTLIKVLVRYKDLHQTFPIFCTPTFQMFLLPHFAKKVQTATKTHYSSLLFNSVSVLKAISVTAQFQINSGSSINS